MTKARPFDPATERYISLCTFRRDGREVWTPVWVAPFGDEHYVFSEARAGKIKRIRNIAGIKAAACDARGRLESGPMVGSARIVTDAGEISGCYRAFTAKYGWLMRVTNFLSRLTGRYHKRAIIALRFHE